MQDSSIPAKFPIPWGNGASAPYINAIPTASQIGIKNGAASLTDGFPPSTFVYPGSGGSLPLGDDMNGILNQITAWLQWFQAGGPAKWDSTFGGEINGYPAGAVVQSATTFGRFWFCTADNNTNNPDAGGGNWVLMSPFGSTPIPLTASGNTQAPVWATGALIRAWGGGGAGGAGGASTGTGGGGAGGGYCITKITGLTGSSIYPYVIGAGGSSGSGAGGAGGATSFNGVTLATGGSGGSAGSAGVGGAGGLSPGVGTGTALSLTGADGQYGLIIGGGYLGGAGGAAPFGGGNTWNPAGSAVGYPGLYPGGGGSGATGTNNGGAGAAGYMELTWLP